MSFQTAFQIKPLAKQQFAHLAGLSSEELNAIPAVRMVATKKPGFPCRVSLQQAEVGEEVFLLNYEHQSAATPYRSTHAIFVRADAAEADLEPNQIPEAFRASMLSLRAFDKQGMMVTCGLAPGATLEQSIEEMLADPRVDYLHLHFANAGCYAARVERASHA